MVVMVSWMISVMLDLEVLSSDVRTEKCQFWRHGPLVSSVNMTMAVARKWYRFKFFPQSLRLSEMK
jgi:hypothetical protein